MNNSDIVKVFKAFSDERRLEILSLLIKGEKCACNLLDQIDISQATLSHHMRILCESNIVVGRKEGKWTHYSINISGCRLAKQLLDELTNVEDYEENTSHVKISK